MCHQPLSNKGWLRQFLPTAKQPTIDRFDRIVKGYEKGGCQLNKARFLAYREIEGMPCH